MPWSTWGLTTDMPLPAILLIILSVLLGFALLAALLYLLVLIRPKGKAPKDKALLCAYAHRGLHGGGAPENSLAAFALAAEAGYGIELDVQLSRDGTVMVFHDYTLARMTGCDRKLVDLTAAELASLRLAGTDEAIPTLAEVLRLVDGRVPLLVELKGEDLNTALCERVAALLSDYRGAYCIESFNPLLLRGMKNYLPGAYCGLLYTNVVRDKKKASLLNCLISIMALNLLCRPHFIAYNEVDRHALPVRITTRLYHARRFVWTVRSAASLAAARDLGECPIFEHIECD